MRSMIPVPAVQSGPQVTRMMLTSLQVCVPKDWTDEQIESFANTNSPSGISSQWKVTDRAGCEPGPCDDDPNKKHVVLDC